MIVFLWFAFAVLVGVWAGARGRSGFGYFVLAVLISPLLAALIVAVIGPKVGNVEAQAIQAGEMKKCPACAELVRTEARKCKHCGELLGEPFIAG